MQTPNLVDQLARWQNKELTDHEEIALFQCLVETRLAYSLPKHFAVRANELLHQHMITTAFYQEVAGNYYSDYNSDYSEAAQ